MAIRKFEQYTPKVAQSAFIDESAVVTGNVAIGADSSVWPMCSVRGDIHTIRIGERSNIQDGSVLHISHDGPFMPGGSPLTVGDQVTIGHKAILHGCEIGNDCLIGMGAIVMDRVVVEPGVMVGAASLVPPGKDLDGGYLWLGSPVKRARELSEKEHAFLAYSAMHYVELKNRHRD